ncbi:GNAT family N-acetyltransferase [Candidatus Rhodobacter oscarellae]
MTFSDQHLKDAILPLLEGSPYGAIWVIGPRRAPVGYIAVCFGWSIELGGMDGFIDEFYIREKVRGRGMGTEALAALLPELAKAGLKALHLEVNRDKESAARLYARLGFKIRDRYNLMTWVAPTPDAP